MQRVFNIILAIFFFSICGYLLFVESIELPSRFGADASIYTPPVTYLMAMLPLAFGVSLALYEIDRDKNKKLIKMIVTAGVIILFIAMVIVAPLLSSPK